MPYAKHVRTQDVHRIELARRRSKRMFDLRDVKLVGGMVAYEEILSYVPERYHFRYTTFAHKILPLMEKMGHAAVVKRVKHGLIQESIGLETPRHNAWIIQVDALAVWAIYIIARYKRIDNGTWAKTHAWSVDDFINLAYVADEEELAGILDIPDNGKGPINKKRRIKKGEKLNEHLRQD